MKTLTLNLTDEQINYLEQEAHKLNEFHNTVLFTPEDVLKLFIKMDERQHNAGNMTIIDAVIAGNRGEIKA